MSKNDRQTKKTGEKEKDFSTNSANTNRVSDSTLPKTPYLGEQNSPQKKDENLNPNSSGTNNTAEAKSEKAIANYKSSHLGEHSGLEESDKNTKITIKQKLIAYLKGCPKRYFITAFSGMAMGLFCTLIAGTIIENLAKIFQSWALPIYNFLVSVGSLAKILMGAGIGAGIAYTLKAPKMVVLSAIAAGFVGAFASNFMLPEFVVKNAGNPINSYLAALAATEIGILVSGKTKLDILVVPLTCLIVAGLIAVTLGKPVEYIIVKIGEGISAATTAQLFLMSVIVSVVMGLLLTLPTSSAAIGIMIGLSGLASGAAVAGCCCHMIGFAVMSFRENRYSGLIAQGLGTSMLQIPNLIRRPQILIPPVIASAICGPLATMVFGLVCDPAGSGMGSSGLVGIINTVAESVKEGVSGAKIAIGIALCMVVLPIVICLSLSELMRKKGWIKYGDMRIEA